MGEAGRIRHRVLVVVGQFGFANRPGAALVGVSEPYRCYRPGADFVLLLGPAATGQNSDHPLYSEMGSQMHPRSARAARTLASNAANDLAKRSLVSDCR